MQIRVKSKVNSFIFVIIFFYFGNDSLKLVRILIFKVNLRSFSCEFLLGYMSNVQWLSHKKVWRFYIRENDVSKYHATSVIVRFRVFHNGMSREHSYLEPYERKGTSTWKRHVVLDQTYFVFRHKSYVMTVDK